MTEFYNIFGNYINNKIETFADTNDCLIELELKEGEDCGRTGREASCVGGQRAEPSKQIHHGR